MNTIKQKITRLLDDLPPDSLTMVEQFVTFLHQQQIQQDRLNVITAREGTLYRYPTVDNDPSTLGAWLDILSQGYEGNAVADSEALYDEELCPE